MDRYVSRAGGVAGSLVSEPTGCSSADSAETKRSAFYAVSSAVIAEIILSVLGIGTLRNTLVVIEEERASAGGAVSRGARAGVASLVALETVGVASVCVVPIWTVSFIAHVI